MPFLNIKLKCLDYTIYTKDNLIVQMPLYLEDNKAISLLNMDINFQDPIAFW